MKKLPKNAASFRNLYEQLKDAYEFENDGLKPLRSCGTRWISHKVIAIRLVIDKFG